MRILVDQNIPHSVIETLREEGHDTVQGQETYPGGDNRTLLSRAVEGRRVVLTVDKDFGELAFRTGLPASCGIILVRVTPVAPATVADLIARTLDVHDDWGRHSSVVEDTRVRMRPLPS